MKFFIDTANIDEIKTIAEWGILDGITTNPSLVAKAGIPKGTPVMEHFKNVVLQMCEIVPNVSAQVTAKTAKEMIKQADEYHSWHKNVVVKVPMTTEGLKVVSYCAGKNIRTNVTLVFSLTQAIMAAKAGASIISPFVGRIDDQAADGMELIASIMTAWQNYGFDTEVLVASTRHSLHIAQAAQLGAHICTIPPALFTKMASHTLTDKGLQAFQDDWDSLQS